MGLYYHAKDEKTEPLLYNYSGADLIGELHRHFKLPMANLPEKMQEFSPRVPYKATEDEAVKMGEALRGIPDAEILEYYLSADLFFDDEGDPGNFITFVREWQAFLLTCRGYEAD